MPSEKPNHRQRTVVVADDHRELLAITVRILGAQYEVVAQVADGEALAEAVSRLRPDVAVVDISMPLLNGFRAVRRFSQSPQTPVVFLTGHAERGLIQEAFASGGMGYVLKSSMSEDLIPAIEAVLGGERFLSPSLQ